MSWMIRRATASDVDGIVACIAAAFEPYRDDYTKGAFDDTVVSMESCRARMLAMSILVAQGDDGVIVGTVACQRVSAEEGHVRGMAVLPKYSGRGIAGALLAAAEDEIRAQKCVRVTLDTTEYLLRAIRFYERNGYVATGRTGDFFGMTLIEYAKNI